MRKSKKRKITEPMNQICVIITEQAREKLDRIAGPHSLGLTVEELIVREFSRREKRIEKQANLLQVVVK